MSAIVSIDPAAVDARIARVREAGYTRSLTQLAAELDVTPRTISRYRRDGTVAKSTHPELPPLADRLAHAAKLAEVGESMRTISQLAHLHLTTVAHHFPESVWTPEQAIECARLVRDLDRLVVPTLTWPAPEPDVSEEADRGN